MIEEIERIRAAELDATLRIEAAKREADILIRKTGEDAAVLFEKRRGEAESEVRKIRENAHTMTLTFSEDINEKADREVEEIFARGELFIPEVVDLIVKRTIGGSDVLSGKNG